jgi:hypothetical protein
MCCQLVALVVLVVPEQTCIAQHIQLTYKVMHVMFGILRLCQWDLCVSQLVLARYTGWYSR